MNTLHQNVLEAISGVEKVAYELSQANGNTALVSPKYDLKNGMLAGNIYQAHNHAGHYYWIVFLGCWMDKDLFNVIS